MAHVDGARGAKYRFFKLTPETAVLKSSQVPCCFMNKGFSIPMWPRGMCMTTLILMALHRKLAHKTSVFQYLAHAFVLVAYTHCLDL